MIKTLITFLQSLTAAAAARNVSLLCYHICPVLRHDTHLTLENSSHTIRPLLRNLVLDIMLSPDIL